MFFDREFADRMPGLNKRQLRCAADTDAGFPVRLCQRVTNEFIPININYNGHLDAVFFEAAPVSLKLEKCRLQEQLPQVGDRDLHVVSYVSEAPSNASKSKKHFNAKCSVYCD